MTLANTLKLDQETAGLSCLYYHHFRRWSDVLDDATLAMACISTACKAAEQARRLREILVPCYALYHDEKLTYPSQLYDNLRAGLVTAELLLLRALKFEILMSTPFECVDRSILGLQTRAVIAMALTKPECILYTPRTIACAAQIVAARQLQMDRPDISQWKEDAEDVDDALRLLS